MNTIHDKADNCFGIAYDLKRWAPAVINALGESERTKLQQHIVKLNALENGLLSASGVLTAGNQKFKHDSKVLLDCILMSLEYLKGGGDTLAAVVKRSLLLTVPDVLQGSFQRYLDLLIGGTAIRKT